MVRSQVRYHSDIGTETIDASELEGTHFQYVPGRRGPTHDQLARSRAQRGTDVAAQSNINPRFAEKVRGQCRSGGLPVRPGHRDQWTLDEPKSEFGLRDPPHPTLCERAEYRSVRWDSWADHHGVGSNDSFHVVPSQIDVPSCGTDSICTGCSRGVIAHIRDIGYRSLRVGQQRRGNSAGPYSENRHRIHVV
jgi:hypothetical protein